MEILNVVLPVLLYIFGIILLIVLIILGIRLIQVINKVDKAVDDTIDKINEFNESLSIVTKTANGITKFGDKAISALVNVFSKIFNKNKIEEEEDDYFE